MITEWKIQVPEKRIKKKFFGNLKAEVIDKGLCSHCCTCVAICPVGGIVAGDKPIDFPTWVKDCVDCGACVRVCPRWDYKPLSGLGDYIEIFAAKSKRFVGQDGAMVTEITASALEMGLIDVALFVGRDESWRTQVVMIRSIEQLYDRKITGTKYSYAELIPALKDTVMRYDAIGVVGTPCMVSGIRRLQENFKKFKRVKLVIGLFCTENFYYHQLYDFLLKKKGIDLRNAVKTDIKKGEFIVTLKDGNEISFSVKELDEIIPSGCRVCQDFSSVESDVSIGSVGSKAGFSTVIVRTDIAKQVTDYIREKGYAEFDEANVEAVKKLCDFKVKIHPYPPT